MASSKKKEKTQAKKLQALASKIKALISAGKPFHRETAQLHTLVAKEKLRRINKSPEDLQWFLDAFYEDDFLDYGSQLIGAADTFSHIKSVEMTGVPNWVRLTEGLMMGFLLTDLKGTTASDIKMPLPSFLIELPRGTVYTYDPDTGYHETVYLIVSESLMGPEGDSLFIYSWSAPNENSAHLFDDHAEYFPLHFGKQNMSVASVIEAYEKFREDELTDREKIFGRSKGKIFGEEYYDKDFREKLLRIIINTIIYMTSASAVVEHEDQAEIDKLLKKKSRRKLKMKEKMKLQQLENTPHFVLGTDIKITHADIKAIDKARKEQRKAGATGRKLKHPSLTRGHWRWQRYGPQLSEVKRIWIKPFVRGQELGAVPERTYTLENPFADDWDTSNDGYDVQYR